MPCLARGGPVPAAALAGKVVGVLWDFSSKQYRPATSPDARRDPAVFSGSHLPLGIRLWDLRSPEAPAAVSAPSPAWARCWSRASAPLLGGQDLGIAAQWDQGMLLPSMGSVPWPRAGPRCCFGLSSPCGGARHAGPLFFCLAASPTDRGTNVTRLGGRRVPGAGPLAVAPSPP